MTGSQNRESFTPGQMCDLQSDTRGGSRMPELGPYGFMRGARGNSRPYRDPRPIADIALTDTRIALFPMAPPKWEVTE
jgi:hypothetical protein